MLVPPITACRCSPLPPALPLSAEGAAQSSVQLAKVVDECWNRRMQLGDPDKLALQLDRVGAWGDVRGHRAG